MEFEFHSPTRIIFGKGAILNIGKLSAECGKKAFVITGKSAHHADVIFDQLKNQNIPFSSFVVEGEPTVGLIESGIYKAKDLKCDFIIGIGGGSVLDAGKAIASMIMNEGEITDYLEVIGKGISITKPSLPYIAIPTTAGTGTEVTRNAVLTVLDRKVKVSLRSLFLLPKVAVVDPQLTYELPAEITARTGLDALTQLIEAFTSNRTNPIVDGICREGIQRASRSLYRAYVNGYDETAREDMSIASLFGGLALANGKLGAVHGIAGPLGGMFPIPHGNACACLLPHVFEINIKALLDQNNSLESLNRYLEISKILTGNNNASVDDGIKWIKDLNQKMRIPQLSKFGVREDDFPEIIEKSIKASSMKGNPVQLSSTDLFFVLKNAL
ncbi:MAG: iron-containing alcohol dehydrogenase [Chloroflexi bacterium]|nr:iron-containing alcohol dehydrogenase [Chloroflexota bacterium]